jgi:hypothetical protein
VLPAVSGTFIDSAELQMESGNSPQAKNGLSLTAFGRGVPLWVVAACLVALAFAAYAPYLGTGFACDDFLFVSMLEGAVPHDPAMGLWHGEMGSYPPFHSLWWVEPGIQGAFFRPIPSWTLGLMYKTFGRNAVPYHAAMILLHGLVAFVVFLVLTRLSRRAAVALLASALFLICEDHGMTVGWIATITDLMCVLFLNLALLLHIAARQEGRPRYFALSLVFALAAVASKETAFVYPALVGSYELFFAGPDGHDLKGLSLRRRLDFFARRWWAWAAPAALFALYMVFYREVVPPMRNLMYQDPLGDPLGYAGTMIVNLPVMFAGLLTQFLPSIVTFVPQTLPYVALGGSALAILFLWALYPFRGMRVLWFSLAAFVLGLLPGLATDPGERLLYLPSAYGMFLMAWALVQIRPLRRAFAPGARRGVRFLGTLWSLYLIVAAAALPVAFLFMYPSMWISGLRLPENTMLDSMPIIEKSGSAHVVYLNTNSSFNSFYLKDIYRYHRGEYIDLHLLSSYNGRFWARQESPNALSLRTDDRGWLSNMLARAVRVTNEVKVGDMYEKGLFRATVTNVHPEGDEALEVRFDFAVPLDDPSIVFLCYDGGEYVRWSPSRDWKLLNTATEEYGF